MNTIANNRFCGRVGSCLQSGNGVNSYTKEKGTIMNGLRLKQLRFLAENKALKSVLIQGIPGAFRIDVTTNSGQSLSLYNDRGVLRTFPKVETAFRVLLECGITNFPVDLGEWMKDSPKMASGH